LVINHRADDDTWNIHVFSHGGAMLEAVPGIVVFTVKSGALPIMPPAPVTARRCHFRRLHVRRLEHTKQHREPNPEETGFFLNAPECRLDDVEVSGFYNGCGVRLDGAHQTILHRCKVWHNGVNVRDLGKSQASEFAGCHLIYASKTGLVWNSPGLTVTGGAIEQSEECDAIIGEEAVAVARFYGVHFEHKNHLDQHGPMVICGADKENSSTQAVFDHCVFMGNSAERPAIAFRGVDTCQMLGNRFEGFKYAGQLIQTDDQYSKNITQCDSLVIP